MPRQDTVTTTVFKYAELSDAAKEKARDNHRESELDYEWWDSIFDDAIAMGALIGIEIGTRRGSKQPAIYFSGFSSQGDGACCEGEYRFKKGGVKALKAEAPARYEYGKPDGSLEWVNNPGNAELHRIAKGLQEVQSGQFYQLRATFKQRGHYNHSGCTEIEVWHDDDRYRDIGTAEEDVTQLLRDFMDWIYAQLKAEYDWLISDEQVAESIEANEYEFLESGSRY